MKKLTAFEEARKNAKEGKEWFKASWMGYSFVIELDDLENRVNVMELTEGQIYQYDEEICAKYIREATSDKLCRITCDKIRKNKE